MPDTLCNRALCGRAKLIENVNPPTRLQNKSHSAPPLPPNGGYEDEVAFGPRSSAASCPSGAMPALPLPMRGEDEKDASEVVFGPQLSAASCPSGASVNCPLPAKVTMPAPKTNYEDEPSQTL